MAIPFNTGKQSTFPGVLDSFRRYANDTDIIPSEGMNRMNASIYNLEHELLNAPEVSGSNDLVIAATTVTITDLVPGEAQTLDFDSSTVATSALVALLGAENLCSTGSAMLMVSARPTSAATAENTLLYNAFDLQYLDSTPANDHNRYAMYRTNWYWSDLDTVTYTIYTGESATLVTTPTASTINEIIISFIGISSNI